MATKGIIHKIVRVYMNRKEKIKHKKDWERSRIVSEPEEEEYSEYVNT